MMSFSIFPTVISNSGLTIVCGVKYKYFSCLKSGILLISCNADAMMKSVCDSKWFILFSFNLTHHVECELFDQSNA